MALALVAGLSAQAPPPADALFDRFFAAESPADALVVADQITASGVAFDTAYARLKRGRTYLDEKRGEYPLRWRSKSGPFFNNLVAVPADYDPSTPLQLRVQLHGGEPNRIERVKAIVPMKRGGTVDEVAHAILWLLSDEASYTTGALIDVAGGK